MPEGPSAVALEAFGKKVNRRPFPGRGWPGHFFTAAMAPNHLIKEVWASNLEEEMNTIRDLLPKYPFIAMVPNGQYH